MPSYAALGALPELAAEVRSSGALARIAELVDAARASGVRIVHAVAERRPDGRGASRNARLFRAAERLPVRRLTGSAAVRVAAPVQVADEDLVVRRLRGLSPIQGTDVDPLLRDLGCRTLIVTGVSADVAVPDAVFDAVNPRLHGRPAHRRRRGRARRLHPRDDPAHPVPGRHPGDHGRGAHGVRPGRPATAPRPLRPG